MPWLRKLHSFAFAMTLLVPALAYGQCTLELKPGTATRIPSGGFRGHHVVMPPVDYAADRPWPVIFHYHAYSEQAGPNVAILDAATNRRGFVLVGLDYGNRRFYLSLEDRQLKKEVRAVRSLLASLTGCLNIDQQSVFLSGYSQGGYAATKVGEQMLDELAGLVILGAGRGWGGRRMPPRRKIDGKPIFMAAGAMDELHGDRAEGSAYIYAGWGAVVTLERWPDTNHIDGWRWYIDDSDRAEELRSWLYELSGTRKAARAR